MLKFKTFLCNKDLISFSIYIQLYFIHRYSSSCCTLLCTDTAFFFKNWKFLPILHQTSLSIPFSNNICSLCYILVLLTIFPTFSLLSCFLWSSVISDVGCYHWRKILTRWRVGWWLAFLAIRCFKLRFVYCFLRHNAIAHLIDYSMV